MALTITTDLTVITNGNDGTWSDIGGGSGSGSEPDYFIQGTGCRSRAVSGASASRGMTVDIGAGNELDFSVAGANEDELIYFWIQDYTPGLTDALASAPGLTIRIAEGATNGTNYAEWDIIYSDLLAPPGTEFFRVYVLDPRAPPTRTSGTWDYNTCRHFGAYLETNATAKGQNLGIDRICHGRGEIRVTGTADNDASGFAEMVAENWDTVNDSVAIGSLSTARNGIFDVKGSTVFIKGKMIVGDDAGVLATTFTAQDTKFEWLDTFYYDGTRIRSTLGYDDNQNFTGRDSNGVAYYGMDFVGNATGATNVTLGAAVAGDQGRSGPSFTGSKLTPTDFIADDGNVNSAAIYGTTFDTFRSLDLSALAGTDIFHGNSINRCGSFDAGPTEVRNTSYISGTGGAYTFLEGFINLEGATPEQLSTADPSTEWTDLLNGTDWSVPSPDAGYVELLGGTTRTNITHLDDDKVGSDDHYVDTIVRFPAGGAGQGTMGPVIAVDAAAQDYFYLEIDLVNDHVELFRVNTGTDTSIAGSGVAGDFTMDEDEDYLVLLRRNGTTIEAFISGTSVADGLHTLKLSATDAAHTGTAHRRTGLRGDALAGQTGGTGDRPRVRDFGTGPITDNLGQIILPATASNDITDVNLINCARGLAYESAGVYSHSSVVLSGSLVDAHNDSGGAITGNFTSASAAQNVENLGASTSTFTANVGVTFINLKDNTEVRVYRTSDGVELAGIENATAGSADARTFTATIAASTDVYYIIHNIQYEYIQVNDFIWPTADQNLPVNQRVDLNYSDPT